MDIGILGSGMVARTLGVGLVAAGHQVTLGSRDPGKLDDWVRATGDRARSGTFSDAARAGQLLFNCVAGAHALDALGQAGKSNLDGKIMVDVSNPLGFSGAQAPTLFVQDTDSLAEQIQRAYPQVRLVKTLNTVNASLMINPGALPEETDLFLSGDDGQAKAEVSRLLTQAFGWTRFVDLGE